MKYLILILALSSLAGCGGSDSAETATGGEATELRDFAQSHLSRAELTTKLAEAKMTLRVVAQADPQSDEAKELKATIDKLEKQLAELKNSARE